MWDPLRPLDKCEQLLVSRLADVSHWVIRLQRPQDAWEGGVTVPAGGCGTSPQPCKPRRNPSLVQTPLQAPAEPISDLGFSLLWTFLSPHSRDRLLETRSSYVLLTGLELAM